jgi:hypothetical protein
MADLVYWIARLTLVGAWILVASCALLWRSRVAGPWWSCASAAAVFATLRAWPWNYGLLDVARSLLRYCGAYEERFWSKVVLAGALVLLVTSCVRGLRRWAHEPAVIGCCAGLGLQGVLIAIETLSLDEVLPGWLLRQPVRYLAEGCFVCVALIALRARAQSERL